MVSIFSFNIIIHVKGRMQRTESKANVLYLVGFKNFIKYDGETFFFSVSNVSV